MRHYTHVGRREQTGYYAVTADVIRKPGKSHALNKVDGGCRALCGTFVGEHSGDSFAGRNPIVPADRGRVTCKRCRAALRGGTSSPRTGPSLGGRTMLSIATTGTATTNPDVLDAASAVVAREHAVSIVIVTEAGLDESDSAETFADALDLAPGGWEEDRRDDGNFPPITYLSRDVVGNVEACLVRVASDGSLGHLMMATGDHRTSRTSLSSVTAGSSPGSTSQTGRAAQRSGPPETWRLHDRGPAG